MLLINIEFIVAYQLQGMLKERSDGNTQLPLLSLQKTNVCVCVEYETYAVKMLEKLAYTIVTMVVCIPMRAPTKTSCQ